MRWRGRWLEVYARFSGICARFFDFMLDFLGFVLEFTSFMLEFQNICSFLQFMELSLRIKANFHTKKFKLIGGNWESARKIKISHTFDINSHSNSEKPHVFSPRPNQQHTHASHIPRLEQHHQIKRIIS